MLGDVLGSDAVLADKAYSSKAIRAELRRRRITSVIVVLAAILTRLRT